MGLFSKSTSSIDSWKPNARHEAWIALIYGALHIDGEMDNSESEALLRMVMSQRVFSGNEPIQYIGDIVPVMHKLGWRELCVRSAAVIPQEDHETVLAILCDLAMADGVVHSAEENLIEEVSKILGIDEAVAQKIVEVMMIRHKYTKAFTTQVH
jgi:tellurite resistance protein